MENGCAKVVKEHAAAGRLNGIVQCVDVVKAPRHKGFVGR